MIVSWLFPIISSSILLHSVLLVYELIVDLHSYDYTNPDAYPAGNFTSYFVHTALSAIPALFPTRYEIDSHCFMYLIRKYIRVVSVFAQHI